MTKRRVVLSALLCCACLTAASCGGGGDDKQASEDTSQAFTSPPETEDEAVVTTPTTKSSAAIDVETISLTHAPSGIAIDGDVAWYTSSEDDVLVQVDLATGKETAEIPVGNYPEGVAVSAGAVWVTLGVFGDAAIVRVDPATAQVVTTIDAAPGDGPSGIATTDDAVWTHVDGVGRTVRIDPNTNAIIATVDPQPKVSYPGAAWIAAAADAVWVVDRDRGRVLRIDPATNAVVAEIDDIGYRSEESGGSTSILSQGPVGVVLDGDAVWIASEAEGPGSVTTGAGVTVAGKLYRVDPATNTVKDEVPLEETPAAGGALPKPGVAVDGDEAWVLAGDRAWHVDLTDGTSTDLLGEETIAAVFGGVAIGTERVWFAGEDFGTTGPSLWGVDPDSLG